MTEQKTSELARQLMRRVREKGWADAELAQKISPLLDRPYARLPNTISNWRTGHDRMPAEALLAACLVADVSIDEVLFGGSLKGEQERTNRRLDALESHLGLGGGEG